MSLKRKSECDRIVEILSYIRSQVEIYSPGNFTDINIYSENFYRDLLNLIFGYKLVNINILEPNAAAIDLGDDAASIAFQVTSSSDLTKAKKTVKKFNEKDLHKKYNSLIVLNIQKKKNHKTGKIGQADKHQFDPKTDVWDISDLMVAISNKKTPEISEIREFLESEVVLPIAETVPSEIKTFQSLIALLSSDNHPGAGSGFIDEPDPKGKIEDRFSGHEVYLKSEFQDLYSEYGPVLADVREHADIGILRVRRLRLHLKNLSDTTLNECGGNPEDALKKLNKHFESKISQTGTDFDLSAIRFFLIDELIRCNVFPNKELKIAKSV